MFQVRFISVGTRMAAGRRQCLLPMIPISFQDFSLCLILSIRRAVLRSCVRRTGQDLQRPRFSYMARVILSARSVNFNQP